MIKKKLNILITWEKSEGAEELNDQENFYHKL
jgi:hypothetical protein